MGGLPGHQNRTLRSDAWFDSSGMLVKVRPFSDKPNVDKVIGIGISAHEGHLFGWANQLLGFLVALGLVLMSVSGFILWRKRKPKSSLGAPKIMSSDKAGKAVLYLTLALSLMLPVLAISIIMILIIEKVLLSNMPRTRNWLGI